VKPTPGRHGVQEKRGREGGPGQDSPGATRPCVSLTNGEGSGTGCVDAALAILLLLSLQLGRVRGWSRLGPPHGMILPSLPALLYVRCAATCGGAVQVFPLCSTQVVSARAEGRTRQRSPQGAEDARRGTTRSQRRLASHAPHCARGVRRRTTSWSTERRLRAEP
jgi:hypothetical protein